MIDMIASAAACAPASADIRRLARAAMLACRRCDRPARMHDAP
ncbi:hypothetical protein [Burkholderia sp. Bp8998]|nr:hypothetical protein [Burkholderia sp. Bp8998]